MIKELPVEIQTAILDRVDFELQKICPKGGNGYVVLGKEKTLDRNVAIKFINKEKSELTEEPKKLFQIDHPNVLKVYDAKIYADESLYFVTPVANSGDLEDYITKKDISIKKALNITHGILDGLNQLHSPKDIYVHRDLKPSNIFMNKGVPQIGDFGSIKKIDSKVKKTNASQMSLFFKTPECIRDKNHYIESDVYQVGIILFMLLGGKISHNFNDYMNKSQLSKYSKMTDPFEISQFEDECVHKYILNGKIILSKHLPIYIENNLKRIISKATHKDYRSRYHSVTEFMCAICNIQSTILDWLPTKGFVTLKNYKKRDYKIDVDKRNFYIYNKITGSSKWRKIKKSKSNSFEETFKYLKKEVIK